MTNSPKKHIIDALLKEVYGGKKAPDLSDQILRRLESGDHQLLTEDSDRYQSSAEQPIAEPKSEPAPTVSLPTPVSQRFASPNRNWAIAATLLICVGLIGFAIRYATRPNETDQTAKDENVETGGPKSDQLVGNSDVNSGKGSKENSKANQKIGVDNTNTQLANSNNQPNQLSPNVNDTKQLGKSAPKSTKQIERLELNEAIQLVNRSMQRQWHVNVIATGEFVAGNEWLDRFFQTALGRAPEANERERFKQYLTNTESRQNVVEQVFNDPNYTREFNHYWADRFQRYLLPSNLNSASLKSAESRALKQYLRTAFERKDSLKQIASSLLTATGSSDPQAIQYKPASGFLGLIGNDSNRQTVEISRKMLGTELQCAQCHNDSFHVQQRVDFYGLKSFLQGISIDRKTGVSVVSERPTKRKNPGLFFEDQQGLSVYAPPKVAGVEVKLDQTSARTQLSQFVVSSDEFSMAMVNWIWKEVYGYGLSRDGRVASRINSPHFDLLSKLADQFKANDFDFRVVLRWAVLSDAFSVTGNPDEETLAKDIPRYGGVPFFSYVYSSGAHGSPKALHSANTKTALDQLVNAYQDPKGLPVGDRLIMSASMAPELTPDVKFPSAKNPKLKVPDVDPGALQKLPQEDVPDFAKGWGVESSMVITLDRIADSKELDQSQKIEHLFWLALKRKPTAAEAKQVVAMAQSEYFREKSATGDSKKLLQDIWWAIYPR